MKWRVIPLGLSDGEIDELDLRWTIHREEDEYSLKYEVNLYYENVPIHGVKISIAKHVGDIPHFALFVIQELSGDGTIVITSMRTFNQGSLDNESIRKILATYKRRVIWTASLM